MLRVVQPLAAALVIARCSRPLKGTAGSARVCAALSAETAKRLVPLLAENLAVRSSVLRELSAELLGELTPLPFEAAPATEGRPEATSALVGPCTVGAVHWIECGVR